MGIAVVQGKRFIRISEVSEMMGGISHSKVYHDSAAGILPEIVKIGRISGFWSDELDAKLAELPRGAMASCNSHLRRKKKAEQPD